MQYMGHLTNDLGSSSEFLIPVKLGSTNLFRAIFSGLSSQFKDRKLHTRQGFPDGSEGKESASNVGDLGSIPGLERSPGEGHGNPTPGFLPGESPWTGEPGGLQSMGSQRVGHE